MHCTAWLRTRLEKPRTAKQVDNAMAEIDPKSSFSLRVKCFGRCQRLFDEIHGDPPKGASQQVATTNPNMEKCRAGGAGGAKPLKKNRTSPARGHLFALCCGPAVLHRNVRLLPARVSISIIFFVVYIH